MTTLAVIRTSAGLRLLRAAVSRSGFEHPHILVTWSDVAIPELAPGVGVVPGEFPQVIDLNALLAPFHPSQWHPGEVELSLLGAVLAPRTAEVDTVVVEDFDHRVSRALVGLVPGAAVHVLQPGLEAYGPPAMRRDAGRESRVVAQWHYEHLPQLRPAAAGLARGLPVEPLRGRPADWVLVLGSDLTTSAGFTVTQELDLLVKSIRSAATEPGAIRVVPPSGLSPAQLAQVRWRCRDLGPRVEWTDAAWAKRWGTPGVAIGTDAVELLALERAGVDVRLSGLPQRLAALTPFQHPLRLPWILLDSQLRRDLPPASDQVAQDLLDAVSYVIRPEWRPERAERAAAALARLPQVERNRYLWQRRLERLGLVPPEPSPRRWWRRAASRSWARPGLVGERP